MTKQEITTARQRELIARLTSLASRRAQQQTEIEQRQSAQAAEATRRLAAQRDQKLAEFQSQHARLIADYKRARELAFAGCDTAGCSLAQEEDRFHETATEERAQAREAARNLRQHRSEAILTTFQEKEVVPRGEFAQFKQQCEHTASEISVLVITTQSVVRRRGPWPDEALAPPQAASGLTRQEHLERHSAAISRAFAKLAELQNLPAARFLEDGWLILLFIFVAPLVGLLLWSLSLGWGWIIGGSLVTATALVLILRLVLLPIARRQTLRIVPEFQQAVADARGQLAAALTAARTAAEGAYRELVRRRDEDLAAVKTEYKASRHQQNEQYRSRVQAATQKFAAQRQEIEGKFEQQLADVEAKFPAQIERLEQEFERRLVELSAGFGRDRAAAEQQMAVELRELAAQWQAGLDELSQAAADMNAYCAAQSPPWESIDWQRWRPAAIAQPAPDNGQPSADPAAIRFGRFEFAVPAAGASAALSPSHREAFELPAVLSYPQCPSLLLESEGDGREAAMRAMQNVMLRLVTSLPPGKVRFTIIDSVGLGQNFSMFMHLADYDERLVSSRIWTEAAHINKRLADLTEHMENVIQKYLRNEFASIQQYNQHAGEVAEPFQILVIANFPANFSEEAARRLVSIASSGARCGVYTLISTDEKLKLPRNFDLADLEAQAATVAWDAEQGRFRWKYDDLAGLPLSLDAPPDDERFTQIVRSVGRYAKDAARVEVPFETVVPPPESWWSADSRSEIEVPLGRAGATKRQYLRLGKGTSQHVLVAGKTGSGKSTLLNALITNLAIHYSPSELEFYLIDFKKGVEFKAYAAQQLPHARVIAIESEREFGLSVLERLDLELKRRGDLFRKQGVQDVKGFRNAAPQTPMPRIVLVIDEFQEFFTSDDKISHDASLLLDRLVRQGRAFGIHVLLGSQTLAGAYSLARSTIGQMAVRIALQCSESDAHLILSEDNTAARLLSRPGEAIYNDANGLFEGNHPFQIVWLPDHEREDYLRQLSELARSRGESHPPPTVFEGNVAADAADNPRLRDMLNAGLPAISSTAPTAWLGAAVAIKDPTAITLRRQGGSNLLVVGQHEEMALGILHSCLVSLAAQVAGTLRVPSPLGAGLPTPPSGPTAGLPSFTILDGARPDSPEAGFWQRVCQRMDLDAIVASPRDAAQAVGRIAAEAQRRLAAGEHTAEPIFLIIHNLSRFRELKKSDDFGISGFGDDGAVAAAGQLTTILREGPAVGIHTLIWCDSYSSVSRWLDRQTMRDLELRVLMQMSAADSSNLMDSPAASRLGAHTAMFFSEGQGTAEKFRPYGWPSHEWLAWVEERLAGRRRVDAPEEACEPVPLATSTLEPTAPLGQ
ncbi:MAG TPA: FtsK/SpoIIIE domain-containing protein [Pirellulaceae bacterium]|nr:FtsK/SpoIIIE domain-containing protein [Pirellulaceae bacterium]